MNVLDYMERNGHEQVAVYADKAVGLRAFIAIHDTTLGPAVGGVRIWNHPTEETAMTDVLRLSRAMTYKSAAAGLHFGGGKALIMADRANKTEAMMRSFGRFVESLGGRYVTTEDVGMTLLDLEWIGRETKHILGLPSSMGGSGDTSPMTGYGVYMGMQACAREELRSTSLDGRTIAIQGYGNTARALVRNIQENHPSVKLVITDVNEEALDKARDVKGATIVGSDEIYDVECDIFAPCALGGVLNGDTIPRLRCQIICGSANNQLLELEHGEAIQRRGILYAPDYIVNAGGVINISCESRNGYSESAAVEKTARIYDTIEQVIAISKKSDISTARAANKLAEERIASVKKVRNSYR